MLSTSLCLNPKPFPTILQCIKDEVHNTDGLRSLPSITFYLIYVSGGEICPNSSRRPNVRAHVYQLYMNSFLLNRFLSNIHVSKIIPYFNQQQVN